MDSALRNRIGVAFAITGGPQVVLTHVPATLAPPAKVGDAIRLEATSGRTEDSKVGAIEYARMSGGAEFYGLCLEGESIDAFSEFSDGTYEIHPAS
ncbi:hypothetical protein [Luteolibacter marinus]|uniref:hypothetical protein n=1 Tax=Luteolibacter marinus TaxID=2776705 RepID=UPI0018663294|nr:hypothetical protein [Luteolibacter marinus]